MKKFTFHCILICFLVILFAICIPTTAGQTRSIQTHYSVAHGLSENHVQYMIQDSKGLMWFGTHDGLNRFDGYTFTCFKGKVTDKYKLMNFRVNRIVEDSIGYIWIQTDDNRIYRFDPRYETFLPVPQYKTEYKAYTKPLNRIIPMPDSSVFFMSGRKDNQDVFRLKADGTIQKIEISPRQPKRITNKIHQDKSGDTWFLTSEGLDLMRANQLNVQTLQNIYKAGFVCVSENKDFIFFGAETGKLLIFNKSIRIFQQIQIPVNATITDIFIVSESELFISTNTTNFYVFNFSKNRFESYALDDKNQTPISDAVFDNEQRVWLETKLPGVNYFDLSTRTIKHLTVEKEDYIYPNNPRFLMMKDNLSNKWLLTHEGGFYKYNSNTDNLERFYMAGKGNYSHLIHQAITDKQGNLWVNAYLQGIDKTVFKESDFQFTKNTDTNEYDSRNEVRAIFEDTNRQLWVGTKKGYVYIYDASRKLIGYLGETGRINTGRPFEAAVYSIFESSNRVLWIGTKGAGLYQLEQKGAGNYKIKNYRPDKNNPYSINSDAIYSLYEDKQKRIWVGTFGGGLNLIQPTENGLNFINSSNKLAQYPVGNCHKVRFITQDKKNRLLIGTTGGLLVSSAYNNNPAKLSFRKYTFNPANKNSISGNDVYYIHETSKGQIYISVIGGGVNVLKNGFDDHNEVVFETLKSENESSINAVYTILEDNKGMLWMSAQNQILSFNPEKKKLDIYNPENETDFFIDEAAACKTARGEILYGSSNGLISFNPLKIKKSTFTPRIVLTGLRIFNKTMEVGTNDSPLKMALDYTDKLVLNHKQSTFSIEFAALDYQNPNTIQYAYMLDGLDKSWNYSGNQRIATYNNLPRGEYVFKIKSTNSDGLWVENERTLTIVKKPSFWESGWGLLFYFIAAIILILVVVYVLFTIYRLRNEVDVEQRISNIKLRFFTDISHELRTPLTLIAAPVEYMLKKEILTSNMKSQLQIVQKNTDRMLRLINQILDFRKIQNDKMKLILEQVNVGHFIDFIRSGFLKVADEKKIDLKIVDNLPEGFLLWMDKDKFEKIIFNLLSNAFKFSGNGKSIQIIIDELPEQVKITIKDEGIGIEKDKLRFLFDRFETIANTSTTFQASSGIGLSLTKELIGLHKATIEVESEAGSGTVFTLFFNKNIDTYSANSDIVLMDSEPISDDNNEEQTAVLDEPANTTDTPEISGEERKRVLLAEDNHELRGFLKSFLISKYDIIESENGLKALELARQFLPDIIISDIMMPDMDGLELAKLIKDDVSLSHIPFIVLTAKADIESKLQALDSGVDDYITKPFSSNYLEARIDNLLRLRTQLQSYFRSSLTSGVISMSKPEMTDFDDKFIKKTMQYLEENYSNSEMIIEDIAISLGMSRSAFFKKLKNMTGIAPVDFVREFRIQRAAQFIDAGESNISQIAYSVGMNDARYFSRCFKQKFGVNPSEYKNMSNQ